MKSTNIHRCNGKCWRLAFNKRLWIFNLVQIKHSLCSVCIMERWEEASNKTLVYSSGIQSICLHLKRFDEKMQMIRSAEHPMGAFSVCNYESFLA